MVLDAAAAESAIRGAVDKAEQQAGMSIDRVHVALNAGRLHSENFGAVVELGGARVKHAHVDDLLRRGWEHVSQSSDAILHALPVGYSLDEAPGITDPVGYSGERLFADFHAVTADVEPVRRLLGCIEDCYLTPASVVATPYAAALATLRPHEAREGALVIDLGGGTSSLAVVSANHFVFADSLSKGGNQISAALAKRFTMAWRDAELLKLQIGRSSAARTAYAQGAELVAQQYAGILLHLKQRLANSGFALDASNYVVLTGGGALYQDAPRLTAEIFDRPTRVGAPLHAIGLPAKLSTAAFAALWGVVAHLDRQSEELGCRFDGQGHAGGAASLARLGHWLRRIGHPLSHH
jgi:cell division protein FtsA